MLREIKVKKKKAGEGKDVRSDLTHIKQLSEPQRPDKDNPGSCCLKFDVNETWTGLSVTCGS